ncbi:MAG TPA: hypothetical protein VH092_02935 [Urbifossiella sp.]|nr:hypothetical protein [Urbifossiella sp.]
MQPAELRSPLVREALVNKTFPTRAALTAPLEKRRGWLAENPAMVKGAVGFHWAAGFG